MNLFDLIQQFVGQDNEFFKGGLLLAALGFVGAYLRSLPRQVLTFIRIRLIHTLRIDSEEYTLFEALQKFLNNPEVRVRTRTYRLVFDGEERSRGQKLLEGIARQFNADYFLFTYRGFVYYVDFEESKPENGRYRSHYIYRISAYWRARAAMDTLLRALADQISQRGEDELDVYYRVDGSFEPKVIKKRRMETLYYDPEMLEDLLSDIRSFLDSRDWYERLSIPYRRGYLLYGEPGTGKTSLIKGVASLFDKPLYVLSESSIVLNLAGLFQDIPAGSMVVLEDFDRLFMRSENKLSMSALLNQLDGLEAGEGLILFITANHRQVFDAALERPGRIDRKFYIGYMNWASAQKMFTNFYGPRLLERFAQVWMDGLYSPAQLQVYFSKYKHDPERAIARFSRLLEEIGEAPAAQTAPTPS